MIKYDIYMGAHYLNIKARQKLWLLEQDLILQESRCRNPDCGVGEVTLGFEPDTEHEVKPYVKKACCQHFESRIRRALRLRKPVAREKGNLFSGTKKSQKATK